MKRILIAGGSGFIGKHLSLLALKSGYEVSWLTTSGKKKAGIYSFTWDPYSETIDPVCFDNIDVVINLCGVDISEKWSQKYKEEIKKSRVKSTSFLVEQVKKLKPNLQHFINASAVGIYPYDDYESFYEDSLDYGDHFLAEICKEWEYFANKMLSNTNLSILRFGVVFDKNEGAFTKILKNPYILGTGKQWISWIYINDLVRMILFSIENEVYGTYNAVASKPIQQKELIHILRKEKMVKSFWFKIPSFLIKLILGKEQSEIFLKGQFASNIKIQSKGFKFEFNEVEDFILKS